MSELARVAAVRTFPLCDLRTEPVLLYAALCGIRLFEESLLQMFSQGLLAGTTHTCLGQEATAVGVVAALDRERDVIFSNHRGHGHFLAYSGEVERLYLEVMGKPGGICGGRGGSQHLHYRRFYSNGVQGGIVPVGTGISLAEKHAKSGAVTTVFMGDGTLGEGVAYEALNIASLWRLPVLFVIENNGYAQSTPVRLQLAGTIAGRVAAFGIEYEEHATTDVQVIRNTTERAVDSIRKDSKPRALILHNYRLGPHSKGDDTRDPAEIAAARARDPIALARRTLTPGVADEIESHMRAVIDECRARALEAPSYER